MTHAPLILAAAFAAMPTAAGAQATSPGAGSVAMDQIAPARTSEAPAQITPRDPATNAPAQLSEGRPVVATRQIAPAGRSVTAPTGASTTRDSRAPTVSAIGGRDRCDPRATRPSTAAVCRNPLEARAGDFPPPRPTPLSPEQRLLVDQQLRAGQPTIASTVRRLGDDGPEATGSDQAVAATVLANRAAAEAAAAERARQSTTDPARTGVDQSVINAIVGGLVNNPSVGK